MTEIDATYPSTPNLDLIDRVNDKSNAIGVFMEWITADHGMVLGKYTYHRKIQIDVFYDHIDEQRDSGEITRDEWWANIVGEVREFNIDELTNKGVISPECWGQNPDCPDLDDPRHKKSPHLTAVTVSIEDLLYEFFNIDYGQAERERNAVIQYIQVLQSARENT